MNCTRLKRVDRLVLAGLLAVSAVAHSQNSAAAPKPGDVAPVHLGTTLEGKPVLATDFPGKAIVVSYWATWCSFCIKELAMLNAVQTAASDRVQVVTVNIESERVFRKVVKALSRFQILMLYDPNRTGRRSYGVDGVPHMVIIGKDGRIDTVNIGYSEEELGDIVASVNRAIGAIPSK
jgi:thiol-disulfide isomerase/thioredoxin